MIFQVSNPKTYHTTAFLHKLNCTSYRDFESQDIFGQFFGSKNESVFKGYWVKVFKKHDERFSLANISKCEKQTLTKLWGYEITWLFLQKTLAKMKFCYLCRCYQCATIWMSNSIGLTKGYTLWIFQTWSFVWLCRVKTWISQRAHRVKSSFCMKKRWGWTFNKSFIWNINLNYIYSRKMFDQAKIFADQPIYNFLSKYMQKFFLDHVSYFVDSRLVGTVEKTSFSSLNQNWTLSCCTSNIENISWKAKTNSSRNATLIGNWGNWSQKRFFFRKVDKLKRLEKNRCEVQYWNSAVEQCCGPLPQHFLPQR